MMGRRWMDREVGPACDRVGSLSVDVNEASHCYALHMRAFQHPKLVLFGGGAPVTADVVVGGCVD